MYCKLHFGHVMLRKHAPSMKSTLKWLGGLSNQEVSSSASTRRSRWNDATLFDKNKQIFSMLMPRPSFKVEEFRLDQSAYL